MTRARSIMVAFATCLAMLSLAGYADAQAVLPAGTPVSLKLG